MTIERFEDIEAWQEARQLVKVVFQAVRQSKAIEREYRFRDQITSSAVSIMANIAEGFSRKTDKEFTQFLFIAKGSAAELQSHLYAALDQKMIEKEQFDTIYKQTDKVARMVSGFITYLRRPYRPNDTRDPKDPTTQ